MEELRYKIADQATEFEAIHELNHRTFAEEIPQHPRNSARRLVDRFHAENVYAICVAGEEVVGMVAGRCARPFSLDSKVSELDSHLPPHSKAVEIRLLAVRPEYRHRPVFSRLVVHLARHFRALDCDLGVISGTVRQLALYKHLGFQSFGPLVGSAEAPYQPMYLTLRAWRGTKSLAAATEPTQTASFLPGPVPVSAAVRKAFHSDSASHRSPGFMAQMARVRNNLCRLTGASHATVLVGTGTLANEAIAAQIRHRNAAGLVLANGEFGERLAAHARGWSIQHEVAEHPWGECFDWEKLRRLVDRSRPAWIWAVLSETSTGMTNSAERLRELCDGVGADLCLDAISAIGLAPVDLRGVWLASGVSSKGLAAYAGLAVAFHDGRLAPAGAVPRYLDLAAYEEADGVPYTQSSNLIAALDCTLESTDWTDRYLRIAAMDLELRTGLRARGLEPLAPDGIATPGIITLAVPRDRDSRAIALALKDDGVALSFASAYLRHRNWLQICLMGEFDAAIAARIPALLADALRTTGVLVSGTASDPAIVRSGA